MKDIVQILQHKGKKITKLDFSNIRDVDEAVTIVGSLTERFENLPADSFRPLYDLTNTVFTKVTLAAMDKFHRVTAKGLVRSAVIGAEGMMPIIVKSSARRGQKPVEIFDDLTTAMDWLVEEDDPST